MATLVIAAAKCRCETQYACGITVSPAEDASAIAQWRAAIERGDDANAQAWQQRAAAAVQAMEAIYGPYWTRRGEMLLAAAAGAAGGTENLQVLISAAKTHYLREEWDEAVGAYQRAAQTSERAIAAGAAARDDGGAQQIPCGPAAPFFRQAPCACVTPRVELAPWG